MSRVHIRLPHLDALIRQMLAVLDYLVHRNVLMQVPREPIPLEEDLDSLATIPIPIVVGITGLCEAIAQIGVISISLEPLELISRHGFPYIRVVEKFISTVYMVQ